ncbi:unnamed protein product [Sympodiomycopsis kandeliae]
MSIPPTPTKRKVMGRIDLAHEDARSPSLTPTGNANHHLSPSMYGSSNRPVRIANNNASSNHNNTNSNAAATPVRRPVSVLGSTASTNSVKTSRAKVDWSNLTGAGSPSTSSSASAPVTPRIGTGVTTPRSHLGHGVSTPQQSTTINSNTLHAGPTAGVSIRSPSPTRPAQQQHHTPTLRPGMTHSVSTANITPRSAARLKARNNSVSDNILSSPPSPLPHSLTLSSLSSSASPSTVGITSPRSGRSSPVKPAYMGHVRANTNYQVPSVNAIRARTQQQQPQQSQATWRPTSPGSSSLSGSSQTNLTAVMPSSSSSSTSPSSSSSLSTSPRPALASLQAHTAPSSVPQQQQQQRRRASSGYNISHNNNNNTLYPTNTTSYTQSHDVPSSISSKAATIGSSAKARAPIPLDVMNIPPATPSQTTTQPPSSALLSPTATEGQPIEYAQLRVERKIADLEITNKSLLAINSGLEVTKHRQVREIRELKRRLREGHTIGGSDTRPSDYEEDDDEEYHDAEGESSSGSSFSSSSGEEHGEAEVAEDYFGTPEKRSNRHRRRRRRRPRDELIREDPILKASHIRCKHLIDTMLNQAREAIVWQYVHDGSKSKVLAPSEVTYETGGGDTAENSFADSSLSIDHATEIEIETEAKDDNADKEEELTKSGESTPVLSAQPLSSISDEEVELNTSLDDGSDHQDKETGGDHEEKENSGGDADVSID